jgi:hypothetical protein
MKKERFKFINRYIDIFTTQRRINCSHQCLKKIHYSGDLNHHLALLHSVWQTGHYTSQQVIRDGLNTLLARHVSKKGAQKSNFMDYLYNKIQLKLEVNNNNDNNNNNNRC